MRSCWSKPWISKNRRGKRNSTAKRFPFCARRSNACRRKSKRANRRRRHTADKSPTNADQKTKKQAEIKANTQRAREIGEQLAKVVAELTAYEGLAEESRRKMIESMESLSDINLNKGSLGAEKQALQNRRQELEGELSALNEKRTGVFGEKEVLDRDLGDLDRKVSDLKNQILEQEDAVRDCNEAVADIDNKLYNLNSNITMLAAKENFIVGIKESYEGYMPAVRRLLVSAKEDKRIASRIKGVVASLIRTEAKYDVAIETALGASQQNVVTADTEDAKYLIEYLKQTRAGRVTFLPDHVHETAI